MQVMQININDSDISSNAIKSESTGISLSNGISNAPKQEAKSKLFGK
jgi:hypothetical protein